MRRRVLTEPVVPSYRTVEGFCSLKHKLPSADKPSEFNPCRSMTSRLLESLGVTRLISDAAATTHIQLAAQLSGHTHTSSRPRALRVSITSGPPGSSQQPLLDSALPHSRLTEPVRGPRRPRGSRMLTSELDANWTDEKVQQFRPPPDT